MQRKKWKVPDVQLHSYIATCLNMEMWKVPFETYTTIYSRAFLEKRQRPKKRIRFIILSPHPSFLLTKKFLFCSIIEYLFRLSWFWLNYLCSSRSSVRNEWATKICLPLSCSRSFLFFLATQLFKILLNSFNKS